MTGNKWSLHFLNPPFVRANECSMPSVKVWHFTQTRLCGENRCLVSEPPPDYVSICWHWSLHCCPTAKRSELVMLSSGQRCCCHLWKQMRRTLVTPCDDSAQPLMHLWRIPSSRDSVFRLVLISLIGGQTNFSVGGLGSYWATCVEVLG